MSAVPFAGTASNDPGESRPSLLWFHPENREDSAQASQFPAGIQAAPPLRLVDGAGSGKLAAAEEGVRGLLEEWRPVLERTRVAAEVARRAAQRAVMQRTPFPAELLAAGDVGEHDLYRAIADVLGLGFLDGIEPRRLLMSEDDRTAALRGMQVPIHVVCDDGIAARVVSPVGIEAWKKRLRSMPDIALRVRVAPPSALRAAIVDRSRTALLARAKHELFANVPQFSARYVTTGAQGFVFAGLLACIPLSLWLWPIQALLVVNLVASVTFISCVALRVLALTSAQPIKGRKPPPVDPSRLPVYSVLVALYREKQVVPQLLVALGKLQWPRAKLEIKLVCEADDRETLAALRAHQLHPCIEIIEVPPGLPRTKPKALAYALPLCGGEFVTLYDAEDRPHPLQLLEAWTRFRKGPANLACLQAPLVTTNMSAGTLPMMFAFEYAGLFRGLLPWLARWKLMLPLGGTSNHFRGLM